MPENKDQFKVYESGGEYYKIDPVDVDAFKADIPDAKELTGFVVGKDTFDINTIVKQGKVADFVADFPDAKPMYGGDAVPKSQDKLLSREVIKEPATVVTPTAKKNYNVAFFQSKTKPEDKPWYTDVKEFVFDADGKLGKDDFDYLAESAGTKAKAQKGFDKSFFSPNGRVNEQFSGAFIDDFISNVGYKKGGNALNETDVNGLKSRFNEWLSNQKSVTPTQSIDMQRKIANMTASVQKNMYVSQAASPEEKKAREGAAMAKPGVVVEEKKSMISKSGYKDWFDDDVYKLLTPREVEDIDRYLLNNPGERSRFEKSFRSRDSQMEIISMAVGNRLQEAVNGLQIYKDKGAIAAIERLSNITSSISVQNAQLETLKKQIDAYKPSQMTPDQKKAFDTDKAAFQIKDNQYNETLKEYSSIEAKIAPIFQQLDQLLPDAQAGDQQAATNYNMILASNKSLIDNFNSTSEDLKALLEERNAAAKTMNRYAASQEDIRSFNQYKESVDKFNKVLDGMSPFLQERDMILSQLPEQDIDQIIKYVGDVNQIQALQDNLDKVTADKSAGYKEAFNPLNNPVYKSTIGAFIKSTSGFLLKGTAGTMRLTSDVLELITKKPEDYYSGADYAADLLTKGFDLSGDVWTNDVLPGYQNRDFVDVNTGKFVYSPLSVISGTFEQFGIIAGAAIGTSFGLGAGMGTNTAVMAPMFFATYEDNKALAKDLGYENKFDNMLAGSVFSLIEGASELFLPDIKFFKGAQKGEIFKKFLDNFQQGGRKVAIKAILTDVTKEFGEEVAVELGKVLTTYLTNSFGGDNEQYKVTASDLFQTFVFTTLAAGAPSSIRNISQSTKLFNNAALFEMAKDVENSISIIDTYNNLGKIDDAKAQQLKTQVAAIGAIQGQLPADLSEPKKISIGGIYANRAEIQQKIDDPNVPEELKEGYRRVIGGMNKQIADIIAQDDAEFIDQYNDQMKKESDMVTEALFKDLPSVRNAMTGAWAKGVPLDAFGDQAAIETADSLEARMQVAEEIPMSEINQALDGLYKQVENIVDNYSDNPAAMGYAQIVLDKIDKLKSYEFATDKETQIIAETAAVQTARNAVEQELSTIQIAGRREQPGKPARRATVTLEDGTTGNYTIRVEDGNVTFNPPSGAPITMGDARSVNESMGFVESKMGANGMPTSVTFTMQGTAAERGRKTVTLSTANGYTQEELLDIAIDLRAKEIGTVDPTAFDEAFRTVSQQEVEVTTFPNIQQDAIQEQAAGQVPVQPGTRGRQEVAQREPQAGPQEVTPAREGEAVTEGETEGEIAQAPTAGQRLLPVQVQERVDRIAQSIRGLGVEVEVMSDPTEWNNLLRRVNAPDNTQGVFMDIDGKVYLNADQLVGKDGDIIAFHEGTHPIINVIRNTNKPLFDRLVNQARAAARADKTGTIEKVYADAQRQVRSSDFTPEQLAKVSIEDRINDEFVTELIASIAAGDIDINQIPRSLSDRVLEFVNEIAKMLRLPQITTVGSAEARRTMTQIANALRSGADITGITGQVSREATMFTAGPQARGINSEDILSLDVSGKKKVTDVASEMDRAVEVMLSPTSDAEVRIQRFLEEAYKDLRYFLAEYEGDTGLDWYTNKVKEFSEKLMEASDIAIERGEMPSENSLREKSNMDLFNAVLALSSIGINPRENVKAAFSIWKTFDRSTGQFSKYQPGQVSLRTSISDGKGGYLAPSGVIEKETKTLLRIKTSSGKIVIVNKSDIAPAYNVQYDTGEKDKKGNPVIKEKEYRLFKKTSANYVFKRGKEIVKVPISRVVSMDEVDNGIVGKGWTTKGNIVAINLSKLEQLISDNNGVEGAISWINSKHPISELRKYNQSLPDANGSTGKLNPIGERYGSYIIGEKLGAFHQNVAGTPTELTMDLWWSRTWNRYMGTLLTVDEKGAPTIQETPRTDAERMVMREAAAIAANELGLEIHELQAVLWYLEQQMYKRMGAAVESYSFVDGANQVLSKYGKTAEELQPERYGFDSTETDKRRSDAAAKAASIVFGEGVESRKGKPKKGIAEQRSAMERGGRESLPKTPEEFQRLENMGLSMGKANILDEWFKGLVLSDNATMMKVTEKAKPSTLMAIVNNYNLPVRPGEELTKLGALSLVRKEINKQKRQLSQAGTPQLSAMQRADRNTFRNNISPEIERIKASTEETGATVNLDGTPYTGGGLVVPAGSLNVPQGQISADGLFEFINQNSDKISSDIFKVGLYKFPDRPEVSYDLNIVIPNQYRDVAIEFGRLAGQESLFDLDTFENVKTGSDGKNPISFNADQLASIAQDLSTGTLPRAVTGQFSAMRRGDRVSGTYYEPHLTTDDNGNYVFFHVSNAPERNILKGIDSRKFTSLRTSREEKGLQYGVASFYTKPNDGERMVGGDKYYVTVAPEKVYPMDADPNGYRTAAEKKVKPGTPFREEKIRKAVAEAATKDGFEMAVGEWAYDATGMTSRELPAMRGDALAVLKPKVYTGDENFQTGMDRGINTPHPMQEFYRAKIAMNDIADSIKSELAKKGKYDEAYDIARSVADMGGIVENYGEPNESVRDLTADEFDTLYQAAGKANKAKLDEIRPAYLGMQGQASIGFTRRMATNERLLAILPGVNLMDLRGAIKKSPRSFYNRQKFDEIKDRLNTMTDSELLAEIDFEDSQSLLKIFTQTQGPVSGLAFLEYINRMTAARDQALANNDQQLADAYEQNLKFAYETMEAFSTKVAQILRQLGEAKSALNPDKSAELYTDMLERLLYNKGVMISDQQRDDVLGYVKESLRTKDEYKKLFDKIANDVDATQDDIDKLNIAQVNMAQAELALGMYVGFLSPRVMWNLISGWIKGNLVSLRTVFLGLISNYVSLKLIRMQNILMGIISDFAFVLNKAGVNTWGLEKYGLFTTARPSKSAAYVALPITLIYDAIKGLTKASIAIGRAMTGKESFSDYMARSPFASSTLNILKYGASAMDNSSIIEYDQASHPMWAAQRVIGRGPTMQITVGNQKLNVQRGFKIASFKTWLGTQLPPGTEFNELPADEKKRLKDAFIADQNAMMPNVSERFLNGTEAFFSWNAEMNFRLIAMSDVLPKEYIRRVEFDRLAGNMGLNDVQRQLFIKDPLTFLTSVQTNMSPEMVNWWMDNISEMTATKDTGIGMASMAAVNLVKQLPAKITEKVFKGRQYDIPVLRTIISMWATGIDTIIPFVRIPMNFTSFALDFVVPYKSLLKASYFAKLAHKARGTDAAEPYAMSSAKYVSRAVIGYALQNLAMQLLAIPGMVVAGSPKDDDDEEKKIAKDIPRNSINVDALLRYVKGDDPTYRKDDQFQSMNAFGVLGLMVYSYKGQMDSQRDRESQLLNRVPRNIQPEKALGVSEIIDATMSPMARSWDMSMGSLPFFIDQSWFVGVSSLAQAITDPKRGGDKFLSTWTGSVLAAWWGFSSHAQQLSDYYRELTGAPLSDIKLTGELKNIETEGYPTIFNEFMNRRFWNQVWAKNELIHKYMVDSQMDIEYISYGVYGRPISPVIGKKVSAISTAMSIMLPTRAAIPDMTDEMRFYFALYKNPTNMKVPGYTMSLAEPGLDKTATISIPGKDKDVLGKANDVPIIIPPKDYNTLVPMAGKITEKLHAKLLEPYMNMEVRGKKITPEMIMDPQFDSVKEIVEIRRGMGVAISEANRIVSSFLKPWELLQKDEIVNMLDMDTAAMIAKAVKDVESRVNIYKSYDVTAGRMDDFYVGVMIDETIAKDLSDLAAASIDMYVREARKSIALEGEWDEYTKIESMTLEQERKMKEGYRRK